MEFMLSWNQFTVMLVFFHLALVQIFIKIFELVDKMSGAAILGQGSALRKLEGSPQQQQFISTTVYN